MLAPIVTAYEHAMTEGEGRNTWRTDRYSPCPRAQAGSYLAFLASLGYPLSGVEQAVADGTPYTGGTSPADSPAADGAPAGQPSTAEEKAAGGEGIAGHADSGTSGSQPEDASKSSTGQAAA